MICDIMVSPSASEMSRVAAFSVRILLEDVAARGGEQGPVRCKGDPVAAASARGAILLDGRSGRLRLDHAEDTVGSEGRGEEEVAADRVECRNQPPRSQ